MQRAVCLASGGLDSVVCLNLLKRNHVTPLPLFIDYGQLNMMREFFSLKQACSTLGLDPPEVIRVPDFGRLARSGLTDDSLDVKNDAFTPCRNLFFLVLAATYAYQSNARAIVMGLLTTNSIIFPDQTDEFLRQSESAIKHALGVTIRIVTPLRQFSKQQVVTLASELKIGETYSCHSGSETPCGVCISCLEYKEN